MSPDHKAAYFWGGYVAQGGIPWRFLESSLLSRSVSHETFFLGEIFADSDATWATIVARFQGQTIKKTQTFPKHFPTFVIYTKSPKDRRNWGVGISSIWFGPVIFFYPVLQFFVCCLRFPSEFAVCVGICLCGTSKKSDVSPCKRRWWICTTPEGVPSNTGPWSTFENEKNAKKMWFGSECFGYRMKYF